MKKRSFKLTALLLVISLFVGSNAFAFDNSNTYALNTDTLLSDTEKARETEANIAYSNLLDSFRSSSVEARAVSANSSADMSDAVSTEYTVDGIPADGFPDYYAGAYINANHELVVMLTENTSAVRFQAETLAESSNMNYRTAVHPYSELVLCIDEVTKKFGDEGFECLEYALIDDYGNKVVVGTRRIDDEYISFLQQELEYFDLIEFVECEDTNNAIQLTSGSNIDPTTYLYPTNETSIPSTGPSNVCSFGFKATKVVNGVKKYGFVTAGHAVSEGDYIFKGINTTNYVQIGQCLTSINSADRRFDAAFIEAINGYYSDLSSSFTTNNGNRVTSTTTTSIAQNGVVYMCGCRSNEKSGIVLASTFAVSAGTTVFYSDVVLASYSCIPGDSGGLIYELEGNTANPAGIQTFMITADTLTGWGISYSISPYYYGGGYYYSGYCKIGNVLNGIGVSIVA